MWPHAAYPLVLVAPMSGVTDSPFRRFIKRIEPRCIVFTEFISSMDLSSRRKLDRRDFWFHSDEQPLVVQLLGKNPIAFKHAAQRAARLGASGIDINMGCPAKKVVAHQHGSMLMKDISLAMEIVSAVKEAVSIPVSVKTRLGWENDRNLIPFCTKLAEIGLDAITVHGRTYRQKFAGNANWDPIYELKRNLPIPVFGNGDVDSPKRASARLQNLDGLMVGRAVVGNPHLIREICESWYDQPSQASRRRLDEDIDDWLFFAELTRQHHPEWLAARRFRKFLIAILEHWRLPSALRRPAGAVANLADIASVLQAFAQAHRESNP